MTIMFLRLQPILLCSKTKFHINTSAAGTLFSIIKNLPLANSLQVLLLNIYSKLMISRELLWRLLLIRDNIISKDTHSACYLT